MSGIGPLMFGKGPGMSGIGTLMSGIGPGNTGDVWNRARMNQPYSGHQKLMAGIGPVETGPVPDINLALFRTSKKGRIGYLIQSYWHDHYKLRDLGKFILHIICTAQICFQTIELISISSTFLHFGHLTGIFEYKENGCFKFLRF